MSIAYQYDINGFYAGAAEDYGLLPNNAVHTAPELREGFIPRWTGTAWEQVENHKGEEGYVNGQYTIIREYGPLPEGWSDTPPPPSPEEQARERVACIKAELQTLDADSSRAMRAMLAGTATEEDQTRLAELESRVVALRQERAELEAFLAASPATSPATSTDAGEES